MVMDTIGKKILEIRKSKGLTQEELSELAKINLRTLQRIEKDETEPQSKTLKRLCEVLEIKVEDILGYGKKDDNNFLIFFHLSVLSFFLIPLGNILIPTILWLTRREKINGLNERGADLLNFQILWTILVFISFAASILVYFDWHSGGGRVYMPAIYIVFMLILTNIVYAIVMSVSISKKSQRKYFYPLIKFIKL
jgi:transcriptional regulator with XRE-family HTH domain